MTNTQPIRNVERAKIRVFVEPSNGAVICGRYWPHGESEQIVYVDELPAVEARCQTDEERELFANAVRTHELKFSQWQATTQNDDPMAYPGSPIHEYQAMSGKGLPPISSLEIVEQLPPPATPESVATQQAASMHEMLAQMMELQRQNAELIKALTAERNAKSK